MTENPSREDATKDHASPNPWKEKPLDLKTKVDVSKVDVKGFPNHVWVALLQNEIAPKCFITSQNDYTQKKGRSFFNYSWSFFACS